MITLYGRPNSSNVQKVLWVLDRLGQTYDHVFVGGSHGGNDEDWYLSRNPTGLIPLLSDDGFDIWESNAILRYLAAKYGAGSGLWPPDPAARSRSDRWLDWQLSALAKPMTVLFRQRVRVPEEGRDAGAIAAAEAEAGRCWDMAGDCLAGSQWFAGTELGLADIALAPLAYRWVSLMPDRPVRGGFGDWYGRISGEPGFRKWIALPLS